MPSLQLLSRRVDWFFPSVAVLKIVKTAEVIFRRKVIENDIGISKEKHLDQKIQNSV